MKFNWSTILVIAMALFIALIVGMGIRMANSTTELYELDYYDKGEDYAARMEMEKTGRQVTVKYNYGVSGLVVDHKAEQFDIDDIVLRKMSDATEDYILHPKRTDTILLKLTPGAWVAEIQGEVNSQPFFKKLTINK